MTYRCKHFKIHELVDPGVFRKKGNKGFSLLDDRILITIDRLRERFGSMTINNYKWGGDRKWSGLRHPISPWYSMYSQHTYGRAVDILFNDTTVDEVREWILDNPDEPECEYINAVELGTSWLHIDVRNTDRIKTFYP